MHKRIELSNSAWKRSESIVYGYSVIGIFGLKINDLLEVIVLTVIKRYVHTNTLILKIVYMSMKRN